MDEKDRRPVEREDRSLDSLEFEELFGRAELHTRPSRRRKKALREKSRALMPEDLPKSHRRIFAVPFGALMLLLSVVGLVTVVNLCVGVVQKVSSNEKERLAYQQFLEPVVMYDPTPFDDITKADPEFLLESSIWSAVTVDTYPGKYETDEAGKQIIPAAEVEKHYSRLYGSDTKPQHASFSGYGFEIEYDSQNAAYLVPSIGVNPMYYPTVVQISRRGDSIILRVGYIPSSQLVEQRDGVYKTPDPAKYVNITLRSVEGVKAVSAIQAASET